MMSHRKLRRLLPGPDPESDQLMMECEEEEEAELWFPDSDDEEEKKRGGPLSPCLPLSPPIRNKPQHHHGYDASLGFKLNGVPVALGSRAGGGADLMMVHRGGSCGFTSLLVSPPPSSTPPPPPPSPPSAVLLQPEPTPIITGVVYGEAAERVLSDCRVPESGPQDGVGLQESPLSPEVRSQPIPKTLCLRRRHQLRRPRRCFHCGCTFVLIRKLRGFMCACSTKISESLKIHKINFQHRFITKTPSSKSSTLSRKDLDSLQTPPLKSPRPQPSPPKGVPSLWPPPQGSLVIPLEEFYYGTDDTPTPPPAFKSHGPYPCITCKRAVGNNIQLMKHIEHHAAVHRGGPGNENTSCSFCYRRFSSPFTLQCHLEAVHSNCQSTAVCKICELSFVDERDLLKHMKIIHKPGEMPYVCQVCGYRSSFHSALRGHFETVHGGSSRMLCLYCLKVHRSHAPYQDHHGRHQRKGVFPCDRCRLYFLSAKERSDHKLLHHGTHLRPAQTLHLPPGTTVTVRAYSMVRGTDELKNSISKVIDLTPPPEPPRKKPLENPSPLSSKLKSQSRLMCLECMFEVPDLSHFLSVVRCSRCKYLTHCPRAYANHMISYHATGRIKTKYPSLFQPNHRCDSSLGCVSCGFITSTGDLMANHMTDLGHHTCSLPHAATGSGPQRGGGPQQHPTWRPDALEHKASVLQQLSHCSEERRAQLLSGGGSFVPIHLLTSGTASTQLSVKILSSLPPPCSCPAMTIRVLGPRSRPAQRDTAGHWPPDVGVEAVLGPDKLQVVLFALCSGLPQAGQRYQIDPAVIHSWILQREQDLEHRTWGWDTEPVAEWVLIQREKQLVVQESSLLQVGVEVLGGVRYGWGGLHGWAVDLMLYHHLSLQNAIQSHDSPLPRPFTHKTMRFLKQLNAQMQTFQPSSVACMDELSVFLDLDGLRSRQALQLFGRSDSRCCDVVLSGLADGTFLKPALFFKGPEPCLPRGFPDNVLLEARPEGFTDQQRLQLWFNKVWQPHLEQGRGFSLLLMDKHRGHEGAEFSTALSVSSSLSAIIPIGCSSHLQPLDTCITPVIREFLQARWSQLVTPEAAGGGLEEEQGDDGLGPEELALTLACWLSEVAFTLDGMPHILTRSFSVVSSTSQKREGQGQMIRDLAESLIGQQKEPMEEGEGEVEV